MYMVIGEKKLMKKKSDSEVTETSCCWIIPVFCVWLQCAVMDRHVDPLPLSVSSTSRLNIGNPPPPPGKVHWKQTGSKSIHPWGSCTQNRLEALEALLPQRSAWIWLGNVECKGAQK
jgi:hypothetical protein